MTSLVELGLSNAAVALLLAVVATLVGLVCRRPAVVHALWLLVLLKLVTPPLVRVPLPWPAPVEAASAPEERPAETSPDVEETFVDEPFVEDDSLDEVAPVSEDAVAPEAAAPDESARDNPAVKVMPWTVHAGSVWLLGSLAWFALAGFRLWSFGRLLRQARPAPRTLQQRIERLARQVGLTVCPEVRLLPGRLAPMVWGAGAPLLLVPERLEEQVGPDALDTLLLHELAHVRRRDHLVRLLEFVALGLYWWLPVVWFARRELREAEEQCCDAWVVRTLPGSGRLYATALVDALDFLSQAPAPMPPLSCGLGQVADLKRRLTMILRGRTPPVLGPLAGLGVLALAALLLPLVPGLGQAQAPPEERKKEFRRIDPQGRGGDRELEEVEKQLRQKMAEIEALRKKMEEMRHRKVPEGKGPGPHAGGGGGLVIRIEISGLPGKPEELKELVEKLEKSLPGKEKRIVVVTGQGGPRGFPPMAAGRADSRRRIEVEIHRGEAPRPGTFRPAVTPPAPMGGGPRGGPDPRIEGLEKKLESILRELESLRRDMRGPGRPGGAPFGPGGRPGAGEGGRGGPRPGGPGDGRGPDRPGTPGRPTAPPAPPRPVDAPTP